MTMSSANTNNSNAISVICSLWEITKLKDIFVDKKVKKDDLSKSGNPN
jgi:hypothetical protein